MTAWIAAAGWQETASVPEAEDVVRSARSVVSAAHELELAIRAVLYAGASRFAQPPDSVLIAHSLGAQNALSASVNNSCASVVSAIDLGSAYVASSEGSACIVAAASALGTYRMTALAPPEVCAAGALLLSSVPAGFRIVSTSHYADARFYGLKVIAATGDSKRPYAFRENREHELWAEYRACARSVPVRVMESTLQGSGWRAEDVDHWILHQSEVTEEWTRRLGIRPPPPGPQAGSVSLIAQIERMLAEGSGSPARVAVLEIGLGLTVSAMLLERCARGMR